MQRESVKGKLGGRTYEIQRLVGRALRGVVDTSVMGERTVTIDCDVLQADGGTRCASITGGYIALALALRKAGLERALINKIAAISVGIVAALLYLFFLILFMIVLISSSSLCRLLPIRYNAAKSMISMDMINEGSNEKSCVSKSIIRINKILKRRNSL